MILLYRMHPQRGAFCVCNGRAPASKLWLPCHLERSVAESKPKRSAGRGARSSPRGSRKDYHQSPPLQRGRRCYVSPKKATARLSPPPGGGRATMWQGELAAVEITKRQRQSGFHIRRLPPPQAVPLPPRGRQPYAFSLAGSRSPFGAPHAAERAKMLRLLAKEGIP